MKSNLLKAACVVALIGGAAGTLVPPVLAFEPQASANAVGKSIGLTKISEGFIYETAPFPSCHASTIEEAADGTLITAWFGGQHEKADDVGIWVSRFIDNEWTTPVEVANGIQFQWSVPQPIGGSAAGNDGASTDDPQLISSVKRYPTWNPVLFQPSKGPLLLYYKAGPNPDAWWGMVSESHDHGVSWSQGVRLPEGILGPIKNKPIELADGTILCPSSNETPGEDDRWTVHFESYDPSTKSWTRTPPLNTGKDIGAIQPSLLRLGGEALLAVGRSRDGKLFKIDSPNNGKTWGKISFIDVPNPNSGTDAVTLQSGEHLLVYNHVTKETQEWGGRRSPLNVAISKDGERWEQVLELENEPKKEFSYPAVIQTKDGKIHITYTWNRVRIKHVVLDIEPR